MNNNNIIGIIPCAGTASRLHNLPKFMLPTKDNNECLIKKYIFAWMAYQQYSILLNNIKVIKYIFIYFFCIYSMSNKSFI